MFRDNQDFSKPRRVAAGAMLTALALALSYTERFIPLQLLIPLPGVKLGLANLVTLFVLYFWGAGQALGILVLRCFFGAVFGGGITGLLFSLTGGLLALGAMTLARRIPGLSIYGVSILGAAAHNIGQIAAAMAVMHSVYVAGYLPWLLLVSLLTGSLLAAGAAGCFRGLLAAGFRPRKLRKL